MANEIRADASQALVDQKDELRPQDFVNSAADSGLGLMTVLRSYLPGASARRNKFVMI